MDFYTISVKEEKDGTLIVSPDWVVGRSKDLMVRGRSFYAVWNEHDGLWSTDEYDLRRIVDAEMDRFVAENGKRGVYRVNHLSKFSTKGWTEFRRYLQNISDNYQALDSELVFANTEVKKHDYASRRLPYALEKGSTEAWDELLGVLYSEDERDKIEWAIGAVVAGDSKRIQKFLVFYGPAGSGKSTVLNIIQKLFDGYCTMFDAKALGSASNSFSTEAFKGNPLVGIQHDGDLSKIDDNTKLNSIISHEEMTMNEKFKPGYSAKVNAFLFMGTNQPVRISDAKSGIIRRLIDVHPTGARIDAERYHILLQKIDFELGAIAHKCLGKYKEMGRNYYSSYRPVEMMLQTDEFYNFIEAYYDIFRAEDAVTLKRAYLLYKEYCEDSNITRMMPRFKFREELRNYFDHFEERASFQGEKVRSLYTGFKGMSTVSKNRTFVPDTAYVIDLEDVAEVYLDHSSPFDRLMAEQPAQYAKESGYPGMKWENVTTTLKDLDPSKLHFVKVPEQHIVIDFDLTDEDGEKSIERNIEAASIWPPTYTELSRSGKGLHLHYTYFGDVTELSSVFDVGIEVKTLLGDSSLRRKLTRCNTLDIAVLNRALPKKERPAVIDAKNIASEKGLRNLIERNLRKEIHPGTKPSIDFIEKILQDSYDSGMAYDVTDMRAHILTFAARSTNQAAECLRTVQRMKFASEHSVEEKLSDEEKPIVLYDVEVYPNLFVVCWGAEDAPDSAITRMINPTAADIEALLEMKLVGFNNRRYDNHILYGRFLGYSLEELFELSQRMINESTGYFREAYNISYTDIYDFASEKMGLKKWEIKLGIHHMELDLPWDKPVPEEKWPMVVDYCVNDVVATKAVFKDRRQDFVARQILADLSGLSVNAPTLSHTAKIIFGDDKNPQDKFIYTDLSTEFPGYKYDHGTSTYRDEVTGEGGYVYAEPGYYESVAVLDVASMHPTSIGRLNLFGPYTGNFSALLDARLAIKRQEYENARLLLDGRLRPFLTDAESDPESAAKLAYALKIVVNIVYGLTSARFPNPFKDNRNKDNIVAKRGALFMIDLKHAVQEQGFTVAHIKTDSIKIPMATPEIIQFVTNFGKKYGYDFEHEATYDKFCLVNDAVYIAREGDQWTAVGAQFQHPYVFKTMFTKEPIEFDDFCEAKSVQQGSMYLDFKGSDNIDDYVHVGRTGSFVPVRHDGGVLWRIKDGVKYHVTGTKGYSWLVRENAYDRVRLEDELLIDMQYFEELVLKATSAIEEYEPLERFIL